MPAMDHDMQPNSTGDPPVPIRFTDDRAGLIILDQTQLPGVETYRELRTLQDVREAIRSLRVRGAPLIGITAAMGVSALARSSTVGAAADGGATPSVDEVTEWCRHLAEARPTAINLGWALARMAQAAGRAEPAALVDVLHDEAVAILEEDRAMCRGIGEQALHLLPDGSTVLTHCNAGALATGGIGTALAPIYLAHQAGRSIRVFADETRPLLQGSRLTAWELGRAGVEVTVIADNMAGALFSEVGIDIVLVGADRIAANGDAANKVGTFTLAVLARHHGVPFYVLAPTSTVDLSTATGADIPIEFREAEEIREGFGKLTAPADAQVWSPAFDVTPVDLITGIVTEQGLHEMPLDRGLERAVRDAERERARHDTSVERSAPDG